MGNRELSMAALRVIRALISNTAEPHYGLALASQSGVKAGALYPILARLESDGWITGFWEQIDEHAAGRRRRRYYTLTAAGESEGRKVLQRTAAELTPPESPPRAGPRRAWSQ